jgi:glycosyltransferase involved in cell wall biosynthesis
MKEEQSKRADSSFLPSSLRVALVHDWLTGMRGGEKCLEALCTLWPQAPLLALLHVAGSVSRCIEDRAIQTTLLQHLPHVERYYRYLLPLMPWAASTLRVPACDLMVSLSHCVAKSVRVPEGVPHVCYCFTPMRYAWHLREAYFGHGRIGKLRGPILERVLQGLRNWDRRTAKTVTHFIAISRTVQERIRTCYGRESAVIYPPVDTDFYCPGFGCRQNYYLAVSSLAPYKRLDLAIEACNRLGRGLILIGTGQEEARLRRLAGPTVTFLGRQSDEVVRDHMRRCRALLFPGEEDFGITPVEAMACGTPVIAYGRGGACETVVPLCKDEGQGSGVRGQGSVDTLGSDVSDDSSSIFHPSSFSQKEPTGIWFDEQSIECLADAIERFEARAGEFSPTAARKQALHFKRERFKTEFLSYIGGVLGRTMAPFEARRAA